MQTDETWVNDPNYWLFVFRLKDYVMFDHLTGSELLNAALEGRPQSVEAVLKIFEIAARSFTPGKVIDGYYDAALVYLQQNSVADAEKLLDKKMPSKSGVAIPVELSASTKTLLAELDAI